MKKSIAIIIIALNIIIIILIIINLNIILISPINNLKTSATDIKFRWLSSQGAFLLYIDDNEQFVSPIIGAAENNEYFIENLEIGKYYWKIISENKNSSVHTFTIESSVAINVTNSDSEIHLKNIGNTNISASVNKITGMAILDIPRQSSTNITKQNMNITIRQK